MIYSKELKRVRFSYDTDAKRFAIVEINRQTVINGDFQPNVITYLSVTEACSFNRFVFSIVQYHLRSKKRNSKNIEDDKSQIQ